MRVTGDLQHAREVVAPPCRDDSQHSPQLCDLPGDRREHAVPADHDDHVAARDTCARQVDGGLRAGGAAVGSLLLSRHALHPLLPLVDAEGRQDLTAEAVDGLPGRKPGIACSLRSAPR